MQNKAILKPLPHGCGSATTGKNAIPFLSRARQQAVFGQFQHPAKSLAIACLLFVVPGWAATRGTRYTVLLQETPVAVAQVAAAKQSRRFSASDHRRKIEGDQAALGRRMAAANITVFDATQGLLNAVYVVADREQAAALRTMPGVLRVVEMTPIKRLMVKAAELANASAGWSKVGGEGDAGAGVKIAVLDTGIDQTHAAFQDASLSAPPGYPRCVDRDCPYTNSKVIVARSYVDSLVLAEEPEFSRPDDLSPRDRVGHGTAVAMVAAGARHNSPLGPISGIAPKAYLGNYKIFGSPGVNDVTFDNTIVRALEDALADDMDMAVLSLGSPALWLPDDRGSICNLPTGSPCDPRAAAVENAVAAGLLVVAAAGNDGDQGYFSSPVFNSIHSPATAPSALAVGSITNGNLYFETLRVTGDVPEPLRQVNGLLGNGPRPAGVLRAPVRDVATVADNGLACNPLPAGSLNGAMALVVQGECAFSFKVRNSQAAGAVAVLILREGTSDFVFPPIGLRETGIPAMVIGATPGAALKQLVATRPDPIAEIDPTIRPVDQRPGLTSYFTSFGPSADGRFKPEVVASGEQLYMATQSYDANGELYNPTGYIATQGTSFAAPIAAGAAALFKQRFPSATPAQMKSAVVNTANPDVRFLNNEGNEVQESLIGAGNGKVDANGPASTTITAEPSALSFGFLTGTPPTLALAINNHSSETVTLRLQVRPSFTATATRVAVSASEFSLGGGQRRELTVQLEGSFPAAGLYEGDIQITGGAIPILVPFLFVASDLVADNGLPLRGDGFVGEPGERINLDFKLVDRFGAPVGGIGHVWGVGLGGGRIDVASQQTDEIGVGFAEVILGPQIGRQEFFVRVGGVNLLFTGRARAPLSIETGGVVNAADLREGAGLAPGSYISIFGLNLSESFLAANTPFLPYGLAGVSVSFDVPGPRSLAGRLHFVSERQVNVQVPWELQGLNSAQMKVSIGDNSSALYTVPLNDYSPAAFEFVEPGTERKLAAALDQNFRLITTQNPVVRGGVAQIYANGLGPVDNTPPTGEPSPAQPLSRTRVQPEVTIGGRPARVLFSGLAPAFVGLYQLNVEVAGDTPTGVQPLVITVGGVSSKAANLPVN